MRIVLAVMLVCLLSCDDRAAVHEMDPTLARMLSQRRADPYAATSAFPNGMVMRHPPAGTVPNDDDSDAPPPAVTRGLLELGRARFDTVCAVCHGALGDGVSVVASKMTLRPPPSIVDDENRQRSREELYRFVTEGYGLMPSYADMLSHDERWAVAAYVQALQLSQHARAADLPRAARVHLSEVGR